MPSSSTVVRITDAVVDVLNAAKLSQPVKAARYYLPEFALAEMDELHVSVVPAEKDAEIIVRARDRVDYKIHVAVQKRVGRQGAPGLDNTVIDGLMQLVEEIGDLFRHKLLEDVAGVHWARTETRPIYDQNPRFVTRRKATRRMWMPFRRRKKPIWLPWS
jgi:hypothetical protein